MFCPEEDDDFTLWLFKGRKTLARFIAPDQHLHLTFGIFQNKINHQQKRGGFEWHETNKLSEKRS